MELFLLFIAVTIVVYALYSAVLPKTILSAPMCFTFSGLIFGFVFGEPEQGKENFELLAELTLVLLLFTDASRIDARKLLGEINLPVRLLGLGLPLTVLLGGIAAKLILPDLTYAEAAMLGAMLAPTDAALGQAVVSSKQVPSRIRQALNVESGLNDGIVVPVVLFFGFLASTNEAQESTNWIVFWIKQITLGPAMGIGTAWIGIKLLEMCAARGMVTRQFMKLSGIALALFAWAGASLIGGNGFIAAFAAGMTVGCTADRLRAGIHEFGETEGQLLSIFAFMLYGTFTVAAISQSPGTVWLYAILSLTVARMVPVTISMLRSGAQASTMLFVGWFGPRGLASMIFALLLTSENDFLNESLIFQTVIVTTFLSVVLHGVTAVPFAAWYGNSVSDLSDEACEKQQVPTHPLRYRIHE